MTSRVGGIMAGQGVERREVLRMLALASAVSTAPGFQRWVFAFGEDHGGAWNAPPRAESYVPRFFTRDEYSLVGILAALIIPADDSPGAAEAGVSEFIDTMVAHDVPLQPRFRSALAWMDARSRLQHGRAFAALSEQEQIGFLEPLAYAAKRRDSDEEGRRAFELIREYTVMGFYTSRVGLEQLGDPGLQTYADSPGCPDPSDPLHRHRGVRTAAVMSAPSLQHPIADVASACRRK
jgi:gluconate 2-dehydrogenase gamma chain